MARLASIQEGVAIPAFPAISVDAGSGRLSPEATRCGTAEFGTTGQAVSIEWTAVARKMAMSKQRLAEQGAVAVPVKLDDIEAARSRLMGAIVETDCDWSRTLSDILGCKVWLKFENLQFTASFKERGALNRLSALSADERKRGVIAMSAGNHAQGVAYHASRLAIPATIVMPANTPTVKVMNTRRHGAEVILHGETVEEAAAFAREAVRRRSA